MSGPSTSRVLLTPDEFSLDAKERLGRTNGSIYQRSPGIDGVHDGQIMIRLMKQRFIIIDYSIIPNEDDMQAAALDPCISIPNGAGTQKCSIAHCSKVGVPILLYDSNPGESVSLYMRSGLCYTCQRNLNEKRRAHKKRKKDVAPSEMADSPFTPSSPHSKKFKTSIEMAEQSAEALISEGAMEATRHYGEGPPPISSVLQSKLLDASAAAQQLVAAVTSDSELLSASFSTAVAAADDGGNGTASAATDTPGTALDITTLFEDAYTSLSKSLFLLSQWKTSWDAAVAAAVEVDNEGALEATVSSAAAGVAASSEGQKDQSILSHVFAAESKAGPEKKEDGGEVFSV